MQLGSAGRVHELQRLFGLQVVDEVNRLADKLVAYLCASQQIQDWMCFHVRVSPSQSSDGRRGAQQVKLQLSAREAWIRG